MVGRRVGATADQRLIERIRDAIRELEPGARAVLYGSHARGDAGPESDWDVLVLLDGAVSEARRDAVRGRLFKLGLSQNELVQAIVRSKDEWHSPKSRVSAFHLNVEEDGIELLGGEAAPGADGGDAERRLTEAEMAEGRQELIREWLEQAHEALADAEHAARGRRWNNCVSRLYYACFYAVTALLVRGNYRFSKHKSVHDLFNQHFGHTGVVPADLAALYDTLFDQRFVADYAVGVRFDEDTVRPWLEGTQRLVAFVEWLLVSDDQPA